MSIVVIGNGTLALSCLAYLIETNRRIAYVVTEDDGIKALAADSNLPFSEGMNIDGLAFHEIDYLFSINNETVLSEKTLSKVKKLAINYHNSLLPGYAGVNATAHAINNHEKVHGISWHVMNARIDSGDILIQTPIPIEPDDTTELLNVKCFSVAFESFKELICKLDVIKPKVQNKDGRSYYGFKDNYFSDKSPILLSKSAAEIDAYVRACQFGFEENYFGLPVIEVSRQRIVVSKVSVMKNMPAKQAGLILKKNDQIYISAGDYFLQIIGATNIFNQKFDPVLYESAVTAPTSTNKQINYVTPLDINAERALEKKFLASSGFSNKYCAQGLVLAGNIYSSDFDTLSLLALGLKYVFSFDNREQVLVWCDKSLCKRPQNEACFKYCYCEITKADIQGDMSLNQIKQLLEQNDDLFQSVDEMYFARHKRLNTAAFDGGKAHFIIDGLSFFHASNSELVVSYLPEGDVVAHQETNDSFFSFDKINKFFSGVIPPPHVTRQSSLTVAENGLQYVETPQNIAVWLEQVCNRYPDKDAVVMGETKLSYNELNERSSGLASFLLEQGLRPGDPVAIASEDLMSVIVAIIGVIKTGGFYVPIDPKYPTPRVQSILEVSGTRFFVTDKKCFMQYQNVLKGRVEFVDITRSYPVKMLSYLEIDKNNTAYAIFTSGTTGAPKGVAVSHYNVMRLFKVTEPHFKFSSKDNWVLFHSYCFDFSVWEMFGALLYGGTLFVLDQQSKMDPKALMSFLCANKISILNQTPSYFYQIHQNLLKLLNEAEHYLKFIVFGGEKLKYQALRPFLDPASKTFPVKFINMYGITEITVHATIHQATPDDAFQDQSPIGDFLGDLQGVILDDKGNVVERGNWGELFISGAGVAQGYLNDPILSIKQFVYLRHLGFNEIFYKTGDIVRLNQNGKYEYLSRKDNIHKIRGYRVSLDEVKTALESHDRVERAEIFVIKEREQQVLGAFFKAVKKYKGTITKEHIIGYLSQQLPIFTLPSVVVEVDQFPLTSNGKIDKSALMKYCESSHLEIKQDAFDIKAGSFSQFFQICKSLLNLQKLNPDSDFFLSGGNSFVAMQLAAKCHDSFSWELDIADIYRYRTIGSIYEHISKIASTDRAAVEERTEIRKYPCNSIQKAIWFASNSFDIDDAYNIGFVITFPQHITADAIEEAFLSISDSLSLAASFSYEKAGLYIVQKDKVKVQLLSIPKNKVKTYIEQDFRRSLDLSQDIFVVTIFNPPGESRCIAYVKSHHSFLDGESILIITNIIKSLLKIKIDQPLALFGDLLDSWNPSRIDAYKITEPKKVSLKSNYELIPHIVNNAVVTKGFVAQPSKKLPAKHQRFLIKGSQIDSINKFVDEHKVSRTSFFASAYLICLHDLYDHSPLIGLTLNSRSRDNFERLGSYATLLPLYVDINQGNRVIDVLRQADHLITELLGVRDVPPHKVSNAIRKNFHCALTNLFGYVFTYNENSSKIYNGLSNHIALLKPKTAKYQHQVEVTRQPGCLVVEFWDALEKRFSFNDFEKTFSAAIDSLLQRDIQIKVGDINNRSDDVAQSVYSENTPHSHPDDHELYMLFCRFLKVESFNKNSGFFELGITSLSIFELANLIKTKLNVDIKPADLFTCANFQVLEKLVCKLKGSDS